MRLVSSLCVVVACAAPALADDAVAGGDNTEWRFHCDATDEFFIAELDAAMRDGVGYGETWDETVCNQGNLVLGAGVKRFTKAPQVAADDADVLAAGALVADGAVAATSAVADAPAAAPSAKLTPLQQKMQDQYFALFIPAFGFLAASFCMMVAGLAIFLARRKKQVVVAVDCPACSMSIPFVVGDDSHIFCPACGAACRVDVEQQGDAHLAAAVPL